MSSENLSCMKPNFWLLRNLGLEQSHNFLINENVFRNNLSENHNYYDRFQCYTAHETNDFSVKTLYKIIRRFKKIYPTLIPLRPWHKRWKDLYEIVINCHYKFFQMTDFFYILVNFFYGVIVLW